MERAGTVIGSTVRLGGAVPLVQKKMPRQIFGGKKRREPRTFATSRALLLPKATLEQNQD
jgi:hypothetical protein